MVSYIMCVWGQLCWDRRPTGWEKTDWIIESSKAFSQLVTRPLPFPYVPTGMAMLHGKYALIRVCSAPPKLRVELDKALLQNELEL